MTQESRARIFGPLISTGELAAQESLFRDVFGMVTTWSGEMDVAEARDLFDVELDRELESVTLLQMQTPGVESGVLLVSFVPESPETIRSWDSRASRDALKVIDFYTPDFDTAVTRARSLGYKIVESEARYELPEGTFREAHLWGPDGVVTAFLGGPAAFFRNFAQVTDKFASEVQSISAPLSDAEASVEFYQDVFGWDVVYEYEIDDQSFGAMVGVEDLTVRSRNVGTSTVEPYFGLIDYGLPANQGDSIVGRSRAPRRGLLGAVLTVESGSEFDRSVAAAGISGYSVLDTSIATWKRAVNIRTPHSVPHLLLGPAATDKEGTP